MHRLISLIFIGILFSSCVPSVSQIETVHLPLTSVQSQNKVGFCWAYTTAAMLEAEELRRGGAKLDLSEEYLGYYNLFSQLIDALAAPNPAARAGWTSEGAWSQEALKLAVSYGMVPESVFRHKFVADTHLGERVGAFFKGEFSIPEKLAAYQANPDLIHTSLRKLFGANVPLPTDTFSFEGREYTPISFAVERLAVRPDDYETLYPAGVGTDDHAFQLTKIALLKGYSVPISTETPDVMGRNGNPIWNSPCKNGCKRGLHAMLAVDFVTRGGQGGAMPLEEAITTLDSPLASLTVKNSWGTRDVGIDQDGNLVTGNSGAGGFVSLTQTSLERQFGDVLLPRAVTEAKDGLLKQKLRIALRLENTSMFSPGETLHAERFVYSRNRNGEVPTYHWSLRPKPTGLPVAEGNGPTFQHQLNTPGLFDLTLQAQDSEGSASISTEIAVVEPQNLLQGPPDRYRLTGHLARTNLENGEPALAFRSSITQNNENSTPSYVELVPLTLTSDPQVAIRMERFSGFGNVEYSLNGVDYLQTSPTRAEATDAHPAITTYSVPKKTLVGKEKLWLRIPAFPPWSSELAQEWLQVRVSSILLLLKNAAPEGSYSNARVEPAPGERNSFVPTGTHILSFLAENASEARVFVDGILRKTVALPVRQDPTRIDLPLLLGVGSHAIRVASYLDGVAGTALDFQSLVSALPTEVRSGERLHLDLLNPLQVARTKEWKTHGGILTAGIWRGWDSWNTVLDEQSAHLLLDVSFPEARGVALELDACHSLESTYDFLYIDVSYDAGKTFENMLKIDGTSPGRCQDQNLVWAAATPERGRRALFRVTVASDSATTSSFVLKSARLVGY